MMVIFISKNVLIGFGKNQILFVKLMLVENQYLLQIYTQSIQMNLTLISLKVKCIKLSHLLMMSTILSMMMSEIKELVVKMNLVIWKNYHIVLS